MVGVSTPPRYSRSYQRYTVSREGFVFHINLSTEGGRGRYTQTTPPQKSPPLFLFFISHFFHWIRTFLLSSFPLSLFLMTSRPQSVVQTDTADFKEASVRSRFKPVAPRYGARVCEAEGLTAPHLHPLLDLPPGKPEGEQRRTADGSPSGILSYIRSRSNSPVPDRSCPTASSPQSSVDNVISAAEPEVLCGKASGRRSRITFNSAIDAGDVEGAAGAGEGAGITSPTRCLTSPTRFGVGNTPVSVTPPSTHTTEPQRSTWRSSSSVDSPSAMQRRGSGRGLRKGSGGSSGLNSSGRSRSASPPPLQKQSGWQKVLNMPTLMGALRHKELEVFPQHYFPLFFFLKDKATKCTQKTLTKKKKKNDFFRLFFPSIFQCPMKGALLASLIPHPSTGSADALRSKDE